MLTPEQVTLQLIQSNVSALSAEEQTTVAILAQQFRDMLKASKQNYGLLAYALVGAEIAAEEE